RRQHDLGADRQGARLLLAQLADPELAGGVADPLDRGGGLRRAARDADPVAHHEAAEQADAELPEVPLAALAEDVVTLRAAADRGEQLGRLVRRQAHAVVAEPELA